MVTEELKKNIIKRIIETEKRNLYMGKPKTKSKMVEELERIIVEEVDKYENIKA